MCRYPYLAVLQSFPETLFLFTYCILAMNWVWHDDDAHAHALAQCRFHASVFLCFFAFLFLCIVLACVVVRCVCSDYNDAFTYTYTHMRIH